MILNESVLSTGDDVTDDAALTGDENFKRNKLAIARKMRKPPGTLGSQKFGPGMIWVKNVSTQNTCILAFLHNFVLISGNPTKTKNIL